MSQPLTIEMQTAERPIYRIARLPRWIKPRKVDLEEASPRPGLPFFYLLVDYQEEVRDREVRAYFRFIEKINDLSRLEDASLFTRELKADNETLIFHRVDIIRDGRRRSALNPENIGIYRRERGLKRHEISHLVTVCHTIDDLRVGDLVDIQVTVLQSANEHPVMVRRYSSWFRFDWNALLLKQFIRIVNRSRHALILHHHLLEAGREEHSYAEL